MKDISVCSLKSHAGHFLLITQGITAAVIGYTLYIHVFHHMLFVVNVECKATGTGVTLQAGSESGQIASPGYPGKYTDKLDCKWTIRASSVNKILLQTLMFDIEEGMGMCNDYLKISAGMYYRYNVDSELLREHSLFMTWGWRN